MTSTSSPGSERPAAVNRTSSIAPFLGEISAFAPHDRAEAEFREIFLDRLSDPPSPGAPAAIYRESGPAHFTASLFVVDADRTHVALTLHRKARMWLQFGGHVERDDRAFSDTALREGLEESGLAGLRLVSPAPVSVNAAALPSGFGYCREHWDIVFLAQADRSVPLAVSDESLDVAWFPLADLPSPIAPDLPPRLATISAR